MDFPKNSPDMETGKLRVASRFRNIETMLQADLEEVANSGFADKRLCAMAKSELEKAFLLIEKALRLGAPDDYTKQPFPEGGHGFKQRVDPIPDRNMGQKHVEWHDAKNDDSAE
jgi:hypothetical protein